jgi:N-acetylneuraminic acid mutarotase
MQSRTRLVLACAVGVFLITLAGGTPLVYAAGPSWTDRSPSAPVPSGRMAWQQAARIGDGKVLQFGGSFSWGDPADDTWLYDLATNTWTDKNPPAKPGKRSSGAMAPIGDGKVLLFGGMKSGTPYGDTWLYDLATNTWTDMSPATAPHARWEFPMVPIGTGKVLLFGGYFEMPYTYYNDTWVYDLSSNTWTDMSPSSAPSVRRSQALAAVGNGKALLFGGDGGPGIGHLGDTWLYDLGTNAWTSKSPSSSPSARSNVTMADLGHGRALLFGGEGSGSMLNDTWVYAAASDTWTQLSPASAPIARSKHSLTWLGGGKVLLFGGFDWAPGWMNDTWLFTDDLGIGLSTSDALICTGDTTDVYVDLDNVADLYGHQFTVSYDHTKASAAGAWITSFFDINGNGYVPSGWGADCSGGTCKFARSELEPDPAVSGSGQLAKITLTGVAPGTFSMSIGDDILSDKDGVAMGHRVGAPLPITVCGWATVSGKVTLQGRPGNNVDTGTVKLTEQLPTNFTPPGVWSGVFSATDGSFSIASVPYMPLGSSYKIEGLHGLYLTNDKTVTITGDLAGQNTRLWAGDANNDGSVTITDLACIGLNFGGPPGTCGTTGSSDINADTTTNIRDLVLAGGNFGKSSPRAW